MKTIKIKYLRDFPHKFTGIAEHSNGMKEYCVDGKTHRIDGPAVECSDGTKEYYIDGKLVSKEAQELLYFFMKLKGLIK